MNHYLFEFVDGENEGEQFLVGAFSLKEAAEILAENGFDENEVEYQNTKLSEAEAEASGLDEF